MNKDTLYKARFGFSKTYSRPQTEEELFSAFSSLCRSFLRGRSIFGDSGDTDASSLCKQIQTLLQAFPAWPFSKRISNMNLSNLSDDAVATFYSMCSLFMKYPLSPIVPSEHFISEDAQRSFNCGIDPLLEKHLVETISVHHQENSEVSTDNYLLSPESCAVVFKGKEELIKAKAVSNYGQIIAWDEIIKKNLSFSKNTEARVQKLIKATRRDTYHSVVNSLKEAGFRNGIGALLYGPPGTGKTELAKQIALENHRNLLLVDSSKLGMSYFGEGLRSYRGLFRTFRYIAAISKEAPILFMDEADGILCRRVEVHRSADKEANEIANIVLEEMNSFSGILLATTNLLDNLDQAIYRRFLFKIEFSLPDAETRERIWAQKLPWLSPETRKVLAEQFELSGGQIDNVASLCILDRILDGCGPTQEIIMAYCQEQSPAMGSARKRIGF